MTVRTAPAALVVLAVLVLGTMAAHGQGAPGLPGGGNRAGAEFMALMQRGRQALEIEEFHGARELLERAVELRPDSPEAHYLMARAWAGLKQLKPAEASYLRVLQYRPAHPGTIMGLAVIAEGTGDFAGAEKRYREAIAIGSTGRAQRGLASLLGRSGRGDEAEAILVAILKADPSDADARFELGLVRTLKGECEGAIPEFRKVVEAQPRRVPALFQLGNCLSRTGRPEEATEILTRFRRVKAEEMEREERERLVHFTMLESDRLAAAGRMAAAVAKAREAVQSAPESARARAFLGSLLVEVGDDAGALAALTEAARLDPSDAIALTELGRLLVLSGRVPEAIEHLKRATEADRNLAAPHRFLAILFKQMGRNADAERHRTLFLRLSSRP